MSDLQDRADVARVRGGDTDAFVGIVRRWQVSLVTLAFRFSRDRDQAEEMAQVAFVAAFKKLSQWRGESKFSSWLLAVATNVYRSELRRVSLSVIPLELAPEIQATCTGPGEDETVERARLVRTAVRELPAKYRNAMILFYFHDMDVEETALSLSLPVGTVKAHLHRGRALLERKLHALLARQGAAAET